MRHPYRLRFIFLAVMLLLAATLGWLGWRLLQQEEQLWAQRSVERNETGADLVVGGLEKKLTAIERGLDRLLAGGEVPAAMTAPSTPPPCASRAARCKSGPSIG